MRIAILADMEGISGITSSHYITPEGNLYALGQKYLTQEINLCVEGCFAGGATEVAVYDAHYAGQNILWSELDERAELWQGSKGTNRIPGIESCDGLILLGYHARAGVDGALLEHTYSSKTVQNMWLNGQLAGELAFDAGVASDYKVPVIMTSGDDKLIAEANQWLPSQVIKAQVKTGLTCQGAAQYPKNIVQPLIRDSAKQAVEACKDIPLIQIDKPVEVKIEFVERIPLPNQFARPDLKRLDGRTLLTTAPTVEAALMQLI